MPLKRTGNYTKALLYGVLAVALLSIEGVILVHLLTVGTWDVNLGVTMLFGLASIIWFLIIDSVFVMVPLTLFWRERMLRAVTRHADNLVTLAPIQPDATSALYAGERIIITKQHTVASILRGILPLLVLFIIFALMIEGLIFMLLPALSSSNLPPDISKILTANSQSNPLSFLDQLTEAFPIVITAILILFLIFDDVSKSRQEIIADDSGIMITMLFQRHIIPWHDIHAFVQSVVSKGNNIPDVYLVWGLNHGIILKIDTPHSMLSSGERRGGLGVTHIYKGGFEQYTVNSQRLLATIVVRGQILLHTESPAKHGVAARLDLVSN